MKINKAFTLAEVLIVLGIVGIVAEMTIPALVANYQKTVYVTQLQKSYSEMNQVLRQMSADSGCVNDLKCSGLFDTGTTSTTFSQSLIKYFKVVKICSTGGNGGCFPATTNRRYDNTNNQVWLYDANDTYYKFVTVNGVSYSIENLGTNCDTNWSNSGSGNMKQVCGSIRVDINGLQKPNLSGRDTFVFWITNGKGALLYPLGGADDKSLNGTSSYYWSANAECQTGNTRGKTCAGRIMEEGWQMNY